MPPAGTAYAALPGSSVGATYQNCKSFWRNMLRHVVLIGCLLATGCAALPERVNQPTLHNPFPQISRVGVAPFFNLTTEPTLDGRKAAEAYAAELGEVPGYEVVPVTVIETAARAYHLNYSESDARRLAQILDIDAVVIGAVTEYSPYYPPRLTLKVAWFTANPNYHPIPAGYGLPWGTVGEKDIPGPLAFQAELALAREQLKTQTPPYQKMPTNLPTDPAGQPGPPAPAGGAPPAGTNASGQSVQTAKTSSKHGVQSASYQEQSAQAANPSVSPAAPAIFASGQAGGDLPPAWPDPHGFIPRPPSANPPPGIPCDEPVMQHVKSYRGNDVEFTTALEDYYYSRDDARLGGWQNCLQRSDDFIRFCCRLHIWEMLGARGGAGETRVVWRWSSNR